MVKVKKMQELALALSKTTNSKIVEKKFRENFTMTSRKVENLFKALSVTSNGASQNVKTSSASNDKSLLTIEDGQVTSAKRQLLVAVA